MILYDNLDSTGYLSRRDFVYLPVLMVGNRFMLDALVSGTETPNVVETCMLLY